MRGVVRSDARERFWRRPGCGIIGTPVAYHLAELGLRAHLHLLVEARLVDDAEQVAHSIAFEKENLDFFRAKLQTEGMNWLVRSAIVMLYPRTEGLPGAEDCNLGPFLVRFRREAPLLIWLGVVLGALVFHLTPLFTVGVPLPAFWLPRKRADTHAHRIATFGPYLVRQAIFMVKLPAGLVWGAHPEVRKRFGLPPMDADPGTWKTS